MKHRVEITEYAEQDILDIYRYITHHDSTLNAEYIFDHLQALCLSLAELPDRGHVPPELDYLGIKEYLEVHFKPYRVIYRVTGKAVYILCVADGRRDMRSFLESRLVR